MSRFEWAKYRTTKGGFKLHTIISNDYLLPQVMDLTEGRINDAKQARATLEKLPADNVTVVMDRGYNDYKLFGWLSSRGTTFVTRIKDNAVTTPLKKGKRTEGGNPSTLGDEIGMTGGNDPYCRGGMIWDEEKQDRVRLSLIRKLIKLRKTEKALQCGDISFMTCDDDRKLLSFSRRCTDDEIIVSFNLGSGIERICSDVPLCVLLSDDGVDIEKAACESGCSLVMPACSFAI